MIVLVPSTARLRVESLKIFSVPRAFSGGWGQLFSSWPTLVSLTRVLIKRELEAYRTRTATHFHLADSLVILDNGTVAYQGTWAGLTQDPEHVLKLHIGGTEKNVTEEDPQVDKNIRSQSIKVDEAVSDLSRATGDASLYGNALLQLLHRPSHADLALAHRLLSQGCGTQKLSPPSCLHVVILVLHHIPAVLAPEMDRSTCLPDHVLCRGLHNRIFSRLGFHKRFDVVGAPPLSDQNDAEFREGLHTSASRPSQGQTYTAVFFQPSSGSYTPHFLQL